MLRPRHPQESAPTLERLREAGLLHVEIAWQPGDAWIGGCRDLQQMFPELRLGAASVCTPEALEAAAAAGFRYVVSPVADGRLVRRAAALDLAFVPGVMTPSEVQRAMNWGCPIVKLFPAVSVGPGHWARLRQPLGGHLPFCIAAGGLAIGDVEPWLQAGVDAVALGSALLPAPDREKTVASPETLTGPSTTDCFKRAPSTTPPSTTARCTRDRGMRSSHTQGSHTQDTRSPDAFAALAALLTRLTRR